MTAETLRIHPDEPEPALIDCVVSSLNSGHVVALPTDTFYGLAVDPVNLRAVDRIYELKTRARHKPLSLLIAEVAQAYELARQLDTAFDRLAEKFWPGPLTIVVKSLNAGNVVALPTDTFYGLAVDPVNLRAVERIYEIKTRARHKPLSLLIAEVAQAYELARNIDSSFDRLAEKFWPGPLTIVVKAGSKLPLRVTANTGNLALRVPEAAIPRAVVARLGLPITATSANLSGLPECTSATGVREQLGDKLPLIVDGGPTLRTTATTIVDLSGGGNSWMILREGAIPTHEIALTLQH